MFNKPYDIVVIAALFVAVIATIGFGIEGAITQGAVVDSNSRGFFNSTNDFTNASYFGGTTSDASGAIVGAEGSSDESSSILDLINRGLNALLGIGKTYSYTKESLNQAQSVLPIPDIYITLVIGTLIIILMVIIYTWARGSS